MNAKIFTLTGAFLVLAAGASVHSALGEPEGALPRAGTDTGEPARTEDNAVAARSDPTLLGRLQALETAHRAARKEALKDPKAWEDNRAQRAAAHRQEIAAFWGNVVGSIDGQARLRMNADRMARLNRMLDLAEQKSDATLAARIHADITRELSRHAQAMQNLQAETGMR